MDARNSDRDPAPDSRPRPRTDPHRLATWATVRNAHDLGRFITRVRVATGWTQRDLAHHLGIPVRYLHEIEAGKNTLAYTRLFALLRTLQLDLHLSAADTSAVQKDFETSPGTKLDPASESSVATAPPDIEDWDF